MSGLDQTKTLIRQFRERTAAESGENAISGDTERPTTHAAIQKVTSLKVAEQWRNILLREISRSITRIQSRNVGSDHQIKTLNDSINDLVREKNHWDNRIRQLGGKVTDRRSNLTSIATLPGVLIDNSGRPISASGTSSSAAFHYKYYGRAAQLPGVSDRLKMVSTMYHKKTDEDLEDDTGGAEPKPRDIEDLKLSKMSNRLTAEYFGLLPVDLSYNGDGSISLPTNLDHSVPLYYPFSSLPSLDETESYILERKKAILMSLYGCE